MRSIGKIDLVPQDEAKAQISAVIGRTAGIISIEIACTKSYT